MTFRPPVRFSPIMSRMRLVSWLVGGPGARNREMALPPPGLSGPGAGFVTMTSSPAAWSKRSGRSRRIEPLSVLPLSHWATTASLLPTAFWQMSPSQ